MTSVDQSFWEMRDEIAGAAPEQCKGCNTPLLLAWGLTDKVLAGELTSEEAMAQLEGNISEHCRYGSVALGGCFGGARCNYGVLGQFPSPYWDQLTRFGEIELG